MAIREPFPLALKNLARLLPLRRQKPQKLYHLLLTSSILLTPDLCTQICNDSNWGAFRQYLQELSVDDRVNMLAYYIKKWEEGNGYQALASLILDGYFSIIITTNVDSFLEEALSKAGALRNDMQILLVGRDQPSYIAEALMNKTKPINILKLCGSLNEGVLPASFPDVLAFPREVEEVLALLLSQDTIIVGDLEHEHAIQRSLSVTSRNTLYAVAPSPPDDYQGYIQRVLEARHQSPRSFLVSGDYGEFHTFFPSLRLLLQPEQIAVTEVLSSSINPSPPEIVQLSIQAKPENILQLAAPARKADVLLITATQNEARAILEMRKNERSLCFIDGHPYYDLGVLGNAKIALILQSSMGASGLGGARFTISEGIQALHPLAIIMVGIACGLKPGEQKIGDILVSERLAYYEPQRVGTEQHTLETIIHQRGERISVPPLILSYFKNGHLLLDFADWSQIPNVFFGLVLSGDKLLDNITVRQTLLTHEPEAIGLEMEGVGLYEVATNAHVNWLLVKAISDWGDGKKAEQKEQYQKLAAENAARFTLEIIAQGGFAHGENHRSG